MKQAYTRPDLQIVAVTPLVTIFQGSNIYTDDPQKPEDALVKENDFIWEEDASW